MFGKIFCEHSCKKLRVSGVKGTRVNEVLPLLRPLKIPFLSTQTF